MCLFYDFQYSKTKSCAFLTAATALCKKKEKKRKERKERD